MTNWGALVARLSKAERDRDEWAAGLKDADDTLAKVRSEMAAALGLTGGAANGTAHKASQAPVPKVAAKRRRKVDRKRNDKVLALLKEKGGFITPADIARAHGCGRDAAVQALVKLAAAGKVRRVARGRYAWPAAEAAP